MINLTKSEMSYLDIENQVIQDIEDQYDVEDCSEKLRVFEEIEVVLVQNFVKLARFENQSKPRERRLTEVDPQIQENNMKMLKEIDEELDTIEMYKQKANEMVKKIVNRQFESLLKIKSDEEKMSQSRSSEGFYNNYIDLSLAQINSVKAVSNLSLDMLDRVLNQNKVISDNLDREINELNSALIHN